MAKSTSKDGGSKRSSKSREVPEQVRAQATLNARSFTFTPAPLQKSKGSSKRKATEKEASDNDDDAQLSEEAQRPSIKTVKTVKKVCESTRITCQSGSRRTIAKNFLQE